MAEYGWLVAFLKLYGSVSSYISAFSKNIDSIFASFQYNVSSEDIDMSSMSSQNIYKSMKFN
jgi:hypothetical protein